ncbi:nitrate reductase cytochrome c-type subunit [Usitatibacter palustris]|uniref:Periplasmic nitrate reductase, electron transfer subunit n=1 Tax=Usitatibacter palustris TaxID=2732487 RepID=A0A6M4H5R0_9PROT|nr:nitrate reductase cytochrome c-type subunit [Usitatibacter palustris]QJR14278.1 Periplasmic nitrate reductase, electron transfer subunit [Usitatibacter palustris]
MKRILLALLAAGLCFAAAAQNPSSPGLNHGLRGNTALDKESTPALLPKPVNDDQRKARNYPMQPPLIPHQIDNYQVDAKFNKCMSCHGRDKVADSQAPMVSVTHFMDRDGNMRNEISPRRYFCTQCHVMQTDAKVPVKNTFQDFYSATADEKKGAKK